MKIISSVNFDQKTLLKPLSRYSNKLCIATKKTNLIIEKSQISFLKSDCNYCEIHLFDGNIHLCSKTLKEISSRIKSNRFIRIHQSYVVNIDAIKSIDSTYQKLTLESGFEIPISRAHKTSLKAIVNLNFD